MQCDVLHGREGERESASHSSDVAFENENVAVQISARKSPLDFILKHLRKHGCLLSTGKYRFLTMLVTHIVELCSLLIASALRKQKFKKIL